MTDVGCTFRCMRRESLEKIIETISFLFNEWDGWAVNKIEKRSQLWFDRSERKSWAKDKTFFELNRGYFFTAVNSVHLTLKEKEGWTKPKNMSKETRKELEAERLKDKV